MAEIVLEKKADAAKLRIYVGAAPGVARPTTWSTTPT